MVAPWLNPVFIVMCWAGVVLAAWQTPAASYFELMRSSKYVEGGTVLAALLLYGFFALGSFLASASARRRAPAGQVHAARLAFLVSRPVRQFVSLAWLGCLAAYALAFAPTLTLETALRLLRGDAFLTKMGNSIPGVTTATQFGVFVAVWCGLVLFSGLELPRRRRRRVWAMLASVVVLSAYRGVLWHERLAFIEILVPVAVIWSAYRVRNRLVLTLAPLVAVAAAIALFGLFEYFRSWSYYREDQGNLVLFATQRLLSYYYSSINNFGMALQHIEPLWQPLWTLDFVYKFPVPGNPLVSARGEAYTLLFQTALELHTHPEFNLYSGPGLAYLDFGLMGGAAVMAGFGFLSGRLFNAFHRRALHGLLAYPVWMVGMIDFGRILYWPSSRAFPIWLCVLGVLALYNRHQAARRARPTGKITA